MIIGAPDDVAGLVDPALNTTVVTLGHDIGVLRESVDRATDPGRPGVAVWMLTSGTTGPPKRVDPTYDMLAHSVMGPRTHGRAPHCAPGAAIVNSPLVHVGGVFRILLCVSEARPFVLLEKFDLDTWSAGGAEHRPRAVSLVPAALRMVLHSDLTRDDLAGCSGGDVGHGAVIRRRRGRLHRQVRHPGLDFPCGNGIRWRVAAWTLADHHEFWVAAKRGSVGRAESRCRPAGGVR